MLIPSAKGGTVGFQQVPMIAVEHSSHCWSHCLAWTFTHRLWAGACTGCHFLKAMHGRTTYSTCWCEYTDYSTRITRELDCELTGELTWCWRPNAWLATSSNHIRWHGVYPVVPKILQIILFVLIGCTSDIISEVCISEGMDQAPPVSPLHHHKKIWNIWIVQWKHSYLTFLFTGNHLALTITRYCDFNAALTLVWWMKNATCNIRN